MQPLGAWSWLTDSGWIGVVLGVLALLVGIYFWRQPYRSKRLAWEYMGGGQIISRAARGPKLPLKVLFGDREVSRPNLLAIRVGNAGQQEIRSDDFDKPITFTFRASRVLAYDVVDAANPLIDPTFEVDTSKPDVVTLNPLLLNSREWLQLQFVTDGNLERPVISARIAGETAIISDVRDPAKIRRATRFFFSAAIGFVLCIVLLGFRYGGDTPITFTWGPGLLLVLLMLGVCVCCLLALNGGYHRSAWLAAVKEPPRPVAPKRYRLIGEQPGDDGQKLSDPHDGGGQTGGAQP